MVKVQRSSGTLCLPSRLNGIQFDNDGVNQFACSSVLGVASASCSNLCDWSVSFVFPSSLLGYFLFALAPFHVTLHSWNSESTVRDLNLVLLPIIHTTEIGNDIANVSLSPDRKWRVSAVVDSCVVL